MGIYRAVWSAVTRVVVGVGLAAAAGALALVAPIATLVLLVLGVALVTVACRLPPDVQRRVWEYLPGGDASLDLRLAAALPVLATAVLGMDALLGPAGLQLMLADALAGLPLLLHRPATLTLADLVAEAPAPDPVATASIPLQPAASDRVAPAVGRRTDRPRAGSDLSPAELCHAWQASYHALLKAENPADVARIAEARGRYLDALREWDPDGYARWSASDSPAGSNPSPHIRGASVSDEGSEP